MNNHTKNNSRLTTNFKPNCAGMSLLELTIAMAILTVVIAMSINFIITSSNVVISNDDHAFGIQKAIAMISELRAYADASETAGGAGVLDAFDDGIGTQPILTIDSSVTNPENPLSGNITADARWRYARRITVRKFPSFEAVNVRIITVKIFLTQPGANDATLLADISSVVSTLGDTFPPGQVYDIYLLAIENIPGWWVYMAYLKPFIENALNDMEARNPGLEFRRHWITKAAYGRDQEYKPYFNNSVDSNQDINFVYFYPGTMPAGSAVSQYYVPGSVNARVNIDGTTVNDYHVANNPHPYTLADQYNHAMRQPDEEALFQQRVTDGTESQGTPTYRLLLDDMIANPTDYQNAIFINLHGELIPMPSIRNYSDAAKDPQAYPYWRVVTHPEKIHFGLAEDVRLRVYTYLSDPSITTGYYKAITPVPISLVIPDMDLTQTAGDVTIAALAGGTDDLYPADGITNTYTLQSPAPDTPGLTGLDNERMYATITYDGGQNHTIIRLYNTPLLTPKTSDGCGLDAGQRLYGLDYIPCPVEAANDFSNNLTTATSGWEIMANTPSTVGGGGSLAYNGGDYIYAFRGNDQTSFYRYSISGNSWTSRSSYGVSVNAGGALAYVNTNGRIYGLRGDSQKTFKYYVENSWTSRTSTPSNVGTGGALAYPGSGDFIYAFRGGGSTNFWRYSISGNSWLAMTAAPGTVGAGGALVATGGDFIYAFRGNDSTTFWRYSISGNSWAVMANTAPYNVGAGGALAYPGSGDFIYALQGNISLVTLRYSISGNSWNVQTPVPSTINLGGALVYAGSLYVLRGNSKNTFWGPASLPKNTARWVITIPSAVLTREGAGLTGAVAFETRINDDITTGTMWPARNQPANLSRTFIGRSDDPNIIPFSERYQFQGDPRHCPYADVQSAHGYNWYFDNLRNSSTNVITEWPGIDGGRINNGGTTDDGWHGGGGTGGEMLEMDVPRFFSFIRTALTETNGVYTTITGWSYYYMGLGNEIGYDSSNGFASSIPASRKPFDGGSGSRREDCITTAQTGGVKYIRENIASPYWWGMPWLGELYPDYVYTSQWMVNGNLDTGSGADTFVRIRRRDMTPSNLPSGTSFNEDDCVRRTNAYGCTSLFNIGTSASTFRHQGRDGTTGDITADGQAIEDNYSFLLPATADISRPFRIDNNWGNVPTEFNQADYVALRCTGSIISRFYGHQDGAAWEGSSLVQLQNPAGSNAYIVVNGLDRTVETGTSFIARYSALTLMHSLLICGRPDLGLGTSRVVQLPRVEILQPNVTTELIDPINIPMTWSITWTRWDGNKYTDDYPDGFAETESALKYALLYSNDNGATWYHIIDNTPATAGIPNQGLLLDDFNNPDGNEFYNTWDVSDTVVFPEGSYIVRIEAYRGNIPTHYAYHSQGIFINR